MTCAGDDSTAPYTLNARSSDGTTVAARNYVTPTRTPQTTQPDVLPVLYVGPPLQPAVMRHLWQAGIGLLIFTAITPALRFLRHARVSAVLYGAVDLRGVEAFVATDTPVILLAAGEGGRGCDSVTIIDRHSDPATMAALIRHAVMRRVAWMIA
jgi:hypothetical protein